MRAVDISPNQYIALRREYVFKVDNHRPLIYPLDYNNTQIHFLTPSEGFVLSLLNGRRMFSSVQRIFATLFPENDVSDLERLILKMDETVRQHPSQNGIGDDGLLECSDSPISSAHNYDPRDFIIDPSQYEATHSDRKTMVRLETPINIYTVFTHRCFTRCLYCYAERKKVTELPLSRWREIIKEMADLGIQLAAPDNGDTFARKDGIELLECLLEHKMHFLLSTKAHVSREHVGRLVAAGFKRKIQGVIERRVQLSLDAVDDAIAGRILGIKKARTDLTIDTLENFLSHGIMPIIKTVVTGLNYREPKAIVERLYPSGARIFQFVRYQRSFHRHTDDLFVNAECVSVLQEQFDYLRDTYPDIEVVENLTQGPTGVTSLTRQQKSQIWANRLGCGGGWFALGIAADGKAFLCEQMVLAEPFIVGDARTQSIAEIWNSEKMRRFIHPTREQFKNSICSTCADFEDCMWIRGRCYRDAFFSYGSIYEPPPFCPKNTRPGLRMG